MLAYTRYVLDTGMRGDLLALQVALAPCVIGYAGDRGAACRAARGACRNEPLSRLDRRICRCALPGGRGESAGALRAPCRFDYSTPAREAELIVIFKEATRLEIEFWEMGWRAGQGGE